MKSRHTISAFIIAGIITAAPALSAQAGKAPVTNPVVTAKAKTAAPKKEESQAALQKEAKIPLADATATAKKEVPTGKVTAHELEREKGKLIYSFDITIAGKSGIEEVAVDAMTGAMIEHAHETPTDEAKEATADAKKAAAAKAAAVKKGGGGR